ncbi:MAG: hypothetical protein FWJ68_15380 [Planifilum fulgidum]
MMMHRFWTVLILGLLLITPVYFFALIFTNYFFRYYGALDLLFIAHFFRAFLVLLALSVSQIPFIELAYRDAMGEDVRFKDGFRSILEHIFPVYIMGILYAFLSAFGGLLFIVPGILIAVWLYLFPYVAVIEKKHWWKGFKRAFRMGKKHFFQLLLIVFLFGLFEMIVEYVVLNDTLYLTTRFLVIAVVQLVLNLLFLPLFTFIITYYYIDWNGGKEAFQEEDWGAWEGWW